MKDRPKLPLPLVLKIHAFFETSYKTKSMINLHHITSGWRRASMLFYMILNLPYLVIHLPLLSLFISSLWAFPPQYNIRDHLF
jgi:hypothetical protein